MKQNKYDDNVFFEKYAQMERSQNGLEGAGEWHTLKKMLPDFNKKRVLDLGCGFGWHCLYAIGQGAISAVGVDISENMLKVAKEKAHSMPIKYICKALEDIDFPAKSFDVVISSLTLHYIKSFFDICLKVHTFLEKDGHFVFSVEHPIFTAEGSQEWHCDCDGNPIHWPVDNYFIEGLRKANFLGEEVVKYHKTLTTYLNTLLNTGFEIVNVVEPEPSKEHLRSIEGMQNEMRRPMMLLVCAKKK